MPWVLRGLRDGVLTSRYPRRPDPYADDFPAAVAVRPGSDGADLDRLCPTGAIGVDPAGRLTLDRGRCILCGACVRERPDRFAWAHGSAIARDHRGALVVPERAETDAGLAELRADLGRRVRHFGRSVHIRHVDAGSDGSDEWEVHALLNPVYDVHRLGIFFTASPRHADLLLVTGAGALGMVNPLARTLTATPKPTVVIAAGTDAVSGGLVSPSYATSGGIGGLVRVDVWVPGSPPTPFALLHGIRLALTRVSAPTVSEEPR